MSEIKHKAAALLLFKKKKKVYTIFTNTVVVRNECTLESNTFPNQEHHPPHHLAVPSSAFSKKHFQAIFIATWKANKCHGFSGGEGLWQGIPNIMQMSGYVP